MSAARTPAATTGTPGVTLLGALFLVFIVLKLTHVITWSWWWVTAPMWIPLGLAAILLGLAALFTLGTPSARRRRR